MVKNHPAIANKMPNCQVKAEGNVPRSGARTISIKWKKGFALSKRIPALFGNSSGIQMIGVRKKKKPATGWQQFVANHDSGRKTHQGAVPSRIN